MPIEFEEDRVREALEGAWSAETAIQWSAENPANGQCNVTAAVIHDLFGGDILRTRYPEFWHYYNRIAGKRIDLTDSQFSRPGARFAPPEQYDDHVSDMDAAMEGIPQREFDALRKALLLRLG
ncbi:MAG: YunG family protein [Geminicoccales bacterium]